uniref:Pentatricopeptide repeat-containing protein At4g21170 n=1 Tax=Elaeis guineensis var. tenera TaxID=51953 RepID=A0A6I9RBM0_ELAGV|nr:pentatricopeptide repeat-containing protein At4g21170 [Elaeis guineensis]
MLVRTPHLRRLSTLPTSLKWRNQFRQRALASQISSLLLQRKDWTPLLRSKPSLPTPLASNLFLQILTGTQSQPEISLRFFNWAKSNLGFHPDLRSLSKMVQILVDSDILYPAKHLLDPLLRSEPFSAVLESILRASTSQDSQSRVLSFVLESYANLGSIVNGLEIFRKIRVLGCQASTSGCNALLDALSSADRIRTAWCYYAAVVRTGTLPDSKTWALLAKLLCKEGKLERVVGLLRLGYCGSSAYDLVIDCYCRRREFGAAIGLLNEMYKGNLRPSFGTYSSILDGGCKFGDVGVIDSMLREMVVRELLPTVPVLDYDWVIRRLCVQGKTYAAEMFFERAQEKKIKLEKDLYLCMLRALSKEGRVEEAMRMYRVMSKEGVSVNPKCCVEFLSGICKGEPSEDVDGVLRDVIGGGGFVPNVADLSKYIAAQCSKGRWKEASELLDLALEKGISLDASCCCTLVEHYCSKGLLDSVIGLHDKMKKLGGCFDVKSYHLLLKALFEGRRIEQTIRVFDYMREKNVLSSHSFVIMITALCREKEMRKAMNVHDEMLKVGLKPDDATYKHLISRFV